MKHRLATSSAPRHSANGPRHARDPAPGRRRVGFIVAAAGVLSMGAIMAGTTVAHAGHAETLAAISAANAADAAAVRQQAASRADRSARQNAPPTGAPIGPAKAKAPARKVAAWVLPEATFTLTSCYGPRWGTVHQGIDFAAPIGTAIRAVGAGVVVAAGWLYSGYGISVVIDHGNGYLSHYAHTERVLVHAGQKVTAGQVIALEGETGDATGPHLHFEIHKGTLWNQINPAPWLRAHGLKVGC